jgi:hypothetical protein
VARCAYHPDTETSLTCVNCEKPICPKEMVGTPVGYKCPDCARLASGQLRGASWKQYALAAAYGFGVAIGGGVLLLFLPIRFFFVSLLFGALIGEATRRGSGGHRLASIVAIAAGAGLVGALVSGGSLFALVLTPLAAGVTVAANRF